MKNYSLNGKMMKKVGLILMLLTFVSVGLSAQLPKISFAIQDLRLYQNNNRQIKALKSAKVKIDEAVVHKRTMNSSQAHFARGEVYVEIASNGTLMDPSKAWLIAKESFEKVIELEKNNKGGWVKYSKEAKRALTHFPSTF